jgi:hypothetical protein
MAIEYWILPQSLGGHRVGIEKADPECYRGYYRVQVPGAGLPILVPGEILQAVLPEEPPAGSLVAAKYRQRSPLEWAFYSHARPSASIAHRWAKADVSGEMYTWERINKDHDRIIVLFRGGTWSPLDAWLDGTGVNSLRVSADRDDDEDAVTTFTVNREEAWLNDAAAMELACSILSDQLGRP